MQAFITKGCFTDHGGQILEGDDSWIIEGKGVHLEGMTHWCPTCKIISKAIATEIGFIQVNGKNIIVDGDISTCGSRYKKISALIVRDRRAELKKDQNTKPDNMAAQESVFDEQVVTEFSFAEGVPYLIETETGKIHKGVISSNGKIPRIRTETEGAYRIYLGDEALAKDPSNAS